MFLTAVVRVAPDNELIWIVRMLRYVQGRMVDDIIGILGRRTVRASQVHSPVMGTELVLILRVNVRVEDSAELAYAAAHLRVAYGVGGA